MMYHPFLSDYMDFEKPSKRQLTKKHKETCAKNKRKRKRLMKHKKIQR